jgi:K+/H+ antiporter YhaU regulatory subunit KhtT
LIVGDSHQVNQAERQLRNVAESSTETKPHTFEKVLVTAVSDLCGVPLRDSRIRATFNVTVLGIQRGDQRITGPGPDEILRDGDLLLVMGQPDDTARLSDALTGEE